MDDNRTHLSGRDDDSLPSQVEEQGTRPSIPQPHQEAMIRPGQIDGAVALPLSEYATSFLETDDDRARELRTALQQLSYRQQATEQQLLAEKESSEKQRQGYVHSNTYRIREAQEREELHRREVQDLLSRIEAAEESSRKQTELIGTLGAKLDAADQDMDNLMSRRGPTAGQSTGGLPPPGAGQPLVFTGAKPKHTGAPVQAPVASQRHYTPGVNTQGLTAAQLTGPPYPTLVPSQINQALTMEQLIGLDRHDEAHRQHSVQLASQAYHDNLRRDVLVDRDGAMVAVEDQGSGSSIPVGAIPPRRGFEGTPAFAQHGATENDQRRFRPVAIQPPTPGMNQSNHDPMIPMGPPAEPAAPGVPAVPPPGLNPGPPPPGGGPNYPPGRPVGPPAMPGTDPYAPDPPPDYQTYERPPPPPPHRGAGSWGHPDLLHGRQPPPAPPPRGAGGLSPPDLLHDRPPPPPNFGGQQIPHGYHGPPAGGQPHGPPPQRHADHHQGPADAGHIPPQPDPARGPQAHRRYQQYHYGQEQGGAQPRPNQPQWGAQDEPHQYRYEQEQGRGARMRPNHPQWEERNDPHPGARLHAHHGHQAGQGVNHQAPDLPDVLAPLADLLGHDAGAQLLDGLRNLNLQGGRGAAMARPERMALFTDLSNYPCGHVMVEPDDRKHYRLRDFAGHKANKTPEQVGEEAKIFLHTVVDIGRQKQLHYDVVVRLIKRHAIEEAQTTVFNITRNGGGTLESVVRALELKYMKLVSAGEAKAQLYQIQRRPNEDLHSLYARLIDRASMGTRHIRDAGRRHDSETNLIKENFNRCLPDELRFLMQERERQRQHLGWGVYELDEYVEEAVAAETERKIRNPPEDKNSSSAASSVPHSFQAGAGMPQCYHVPTYGDGGYDNQNPWWGGPPNPGETGPTHDSGWPEMLPVGDINPTLQQPVTQTQQAESISNPQVLWAGQGQTSFPRQQTGWQQGGNANNNNWQQRGNWGTYQQRQYPGPMGGPAPGNQQWANPGGGPMPNNPRWAPTGLRNPWTGPNMPQQRPTGAWPGNMPGPAQPLPPNGWQMPTSGGGQQQSAVPGNHAPQQGTGAGDQQKFPPRPPTPGTQGMAAGNPSPRPRGKSPVNVQMMDHTSAGVPLGACLKCGNPSHDWPKCPIYEGNPIQGKCNRCEVGAHVARVCRGEIRPTVQKSFPQTSEAEKNS